MDVKKRFGRESVLRSISLRAERGEITCIIGPNGSGKSTLLSILAGMLRPDSGKVLYLDKPLPSYTSKAWAIGFVPQQDSLFGDLSVKDNLSFWAAAAGVSLSKALKRPILEEFHLEELLRKRVKFLSGGMRRRVAIAVALVANPALLILDEPFAGLDLFYKHQLTQQLFALRDAGVTILYTSHNADEIVPLSDAVYLLHDGGIALHTRTDTLPAEQASLNEYLLKLVRGENGEDESGKRESDPTEAGG